MEILKGLKNIRSQGPNCWLAQCPVCGEDKVLEVYQRDNSVEYICLRGCDTSPLQPDPFNMAKQYDEDEAQDWQPSLANAIDYRIPFPGVAQDIQQWILATSDKPQPAIALAATLCTLSTVFGRQLSAFNGIKPNVLTLCVAESGDGKDWPMKAARRIIKALDMGDRVIADVASGAALSSTLSENPSLLMILDEYGHFISGINSSKSNQFSREVIPMMTKLYTSADDSFMPKITQMRGRESAILEPHLTVLGMSTERQFLEPLRTADIHDGSLARYNVFFGEKHLDFNYQVKDRDEVPAHIIHGLRQIIAQNSPGLGRINKKLIPAPTLQAEHEFNQQKSILNAKSNEKYAPMYKRNPVKAVQIAMLIDQLQSLDVLDWAHSLVIRSGEVFIKKIEHMAADNETERQHKTVAGAIKEAGKNGISAKDLFNKTRTVPTYARKQMLDEMLQAGMIFKREKRQKDSQRSTTYYFWKK